MGGHPYQKHREHHVERERVAHITGHHEGHRDHEDVYHRARGGSVHPDAAEDKALVKSMVKPGAMKHKGGAAHHRADKRARGGKVKHKGKTIVNVNVGGQHPPAPMPVPVPAPGASAAAPPPAARPPMPSPGGGMPPPGMPPGGPPMGPRASGGRAYAAGGPVFSEHLAKMGPTGSGSGSGKKVRAKGDFAPGKGDMGPKFDSGAGGGVARKEMAHRARSNYAKTPPAIHTPGMRND